MDRLQSAILTPRGGNPSWNQQLRGVPTGKVPGISLLRVRFRESATYAELLKNITCKSLSSPIFRVAIWIVYCAKSSEINSGSYEQRF